MLDVFDHKSKRLVRRWPGELVPELLDPRTRGDWLFAAEKRGEIEIDWNADDSLKAALEASCAAEGKGTE
jgi:hypothetical protein